MDDNAEKRTGKKWIILAVCIYNRLEKFSNIFSVDSIAMSGMYR